MGYPDSNQERQDQNLQCYHYTIAQSRFAISSIALQRYGVFCEPQSFFPKKSKLFVFSPNSLYLCAYLIYVIRTRKDLMKETTGDLAQTIVEGLQEKKGFQIVVADLSGIPDTICRKFVICSGSSPTQVQALAQSVGEVARERLDARPMAVSGLRNAQWVAMDYADVIVHIFLPETRAFYDMEHLWADAELQQIPDDF